MGRRVATLGIALILSLCARPVRGGGEPVEPRLYPEMEPPFSEFVVDGAAKADVIVLQGERGLLGARELCDYVERVSGASMEIVGRVEDSQADCHFVLGTPAELRSLGLDVAPPELGSDGFLIRSRNGWVVMAGETELSQCYAADAFLEKCLGVRWFHPGERGEHVPRMTTIRIGEFEDVEKPDFEIRMFQPSRREFAPGEMETWFRRIKLNVNVAADGEIVVHRFRGHSYQSLLPAGEFYRDHPEYYALRSGERVVPTPVKGHVRTQICTSNPDVVRQVAENICAIFDNDPELRVIGCSPEEGAEFCQCRSCVALDEGDADHYSLYSRRVVTFVNQVADLVAKRHPQAILTCLAYYQYVGAPKDPTLAPRDNVIVQFAHSHCHNHALADPGCSWNREHFNRHLENWRDIVQLGVYEYYYKAVWYSLFWPIVHSIREDIPHYEELGARLFYTQWDRGRGQAAGGLNFYVTAKLLWDTGTDVDALLLDFYRKAYGRAAGPLRRFHERLERAMIESGVHVAIRSNNHDAYLRVFTPEILDELREHLEEAEAAVAGRPETERVNQQRLAYEYVRAVVADYLLPLKAVAERRRPLWFGMMSDLYGEAERIRDQAMPAIERLIREGYRQCAIGPETAKYLRRFGNARMTLEGVGRYFAGPECTGDGATPVLDEPTWLARKDREEAERPEKATTFALWIYGNDFDADESASEHLVSLMRRDGGWETRQLPPPGRDRTGRNACVVYDGFRLDDYPDDRLKVRIGNPWGRWTLSRVYGIYVVPGEEETSDQAAQRRIEGDLAQVRAQAIGFLEFPYDGYESWDGLEIAFEIPLVGGESEEGRQ